MVYNKFNSLRNLFHGLIVKPKWLYKICQKPSLTLSKQHQVNMLLDPKYRPTVVRSKICCMVSWFLDILEFLMFY